MFSISCDAVILEELADEISEMTEIPLKSQGQWLTIRKKYGSDLWKECERILGN